MSRSIDRANQVLETAPEIFKEAIRNLISKWDDGDVDVSCIVAAFVDARDQIEQLEFDLSEADDEIGDLRRDLERLTNQVQALSDMVMFKHRSQQL